MEEVGGVILTSLLLDTASPRVALHRPESWSFSIFYTWNYSNFWASKREEETRKEKRNPESKGTVDPTFWLTSPLQKWKGG